MIKKIFLLIFIGAICMLTACHEDKSDPNLIKVGTIAGPETALMEAAKKVALEKFGLTVKIITFTDYNMPNQALEDGAIDANAFQHQPFLSSQIKLYGYSFAPVGNTFLYPMGLYSDKFTSLAAIPANSKVAIPNDPSNEARALLLLQKAGLITLKSDATINATKNDITENPKKLTIIEADAAQLPRLLDDVSLAAINSNYAAAAGLIISKALFSEDKNSVYMNLIVARTSDRDEKKIKELVEAYQSAPVIAEAKRLFGAGAIPGFTPADR